MRRPWRPSRRSSPQVNLGATGEVGILGQRADVRVILSPDVFLYATRKAPPTPALLAFAESLLEQLEPYANPCRGP